MSFFQQPVGVSYPKTRIHWLNHPVSWWSELEHFKKPSEHPHKVLFLEPHSESIFPRLPGQPIEVFSRAPAPASTPRRSWDRAPRPWPWPGRRRRTARPWRPRVASDTKGSFEDVGRYWSIQISMGWSDDLDPTAKSGCIALLRLGFFLTFCMFSGNLQMFKAALQARAQHIDRGKL